MNENGNTGCFVDDRRSRNVINGMKAACFYTRENSSKTNVSIKRSRPTLFASELINEFVTGRIDPLREIKIYNVRQWPVSIQKSYKMQRFKIEKLLQPKIFVTLCDATDANNLCFSTEIKYRID